ncbi:MAG TPA: HNH endonuclease family protein [Nocardioides sp.]|nr:HNH endonuclease family protein [Nocardioides sp.]
MPAPGRPGRGDGLSTRRAALTGLAAVLVLAGCAATPTGTPPAPAPHVVTASPSIPPPPVGSGAEARTELGTLRVAPRRPPVGYVRDAFGTPWLDTDGNGCNQRDDVLLRDVVPGTVRYAPQGRCDHDVLAGTWLDPYTGRTLVFTDLKDPRQAEAIQIDHLVPLAEAWSSGASRWDAGRRSQFANDLAELLAVDGPTNASKGDDDPAAWRPRKAFQCTYAVRWIGTKSRWQLTVDRPEKRALVQMLGYC